MSDLISRSEVIDFLLTENQRCITSTGYELTMNMIVSLIENQPTAYDIDKVVEQLSKLPQYKLDLADAMIDTLENRRYRHFVCLEDVIEIVKQGGVYEAEQKLKEMRGIEDGTME